LGEKAHRATGAVVAAITALGIAACGNEPGSVTSESILGREDARSVPGREDARSPELANSSFEEGALTPWHIAGRPYARFAVTRRFTWEGQHSLRIGALGRRVRGSVLLGQVAGGANARRGSRFRLVTRVRTRRLNRRVQVEIKLIYDNDRFDFFLGRAVAGSPGLPESGTGIPAGTWRRWITVEANAVAKRQVEAVQVFAFDSGPGLLRGTVWIDSAELSSREPRDG
jgi:hypothetical protein